MKKRGVFSSKDWKYRGEGVAHVLFEYTGTKEVFRDKLIRVKKRKKKNLRYMSIHNNIMKNFFGDFYLTSENVTVTKDVLQDFAKRLKKMERRHKNNILLEEKSVELVCDILSTSVFCQKKNKIKSCFAMEIKPKWGVFNLSHPKKYNGKVVDLEFASLKKKYCRFCMQQHYKKKIGAIKQMTQFCPIQLFCGDRLRSLKLLMKNPQHFLRFLKESSTKLTGEFDLEYLKETQVEILTKVLDETKILERIQRVQLLSMIDIEFIHELFCKCDKTEKEMNKLIYGGFLEWTKKLVLPQTKKFNCKGKKNINSIVENMEEVDPVEIFRKFVLSKSARDCSVLINIGVVKKELDISVGNEGIVKHDGKMYYYHVKVIDLDLKRYCKIPYWYEQDQKICSNFLNEIKKYELKNFTYY